MQLFVEAFVVFLAACLAGSALFTAFSYLLDREWPAFVFLSMSATATVWYSIIVLVVVRAVFST